MASRQHREKDRQPFWQYMACHPKAIQTDDEYKKFPTYNYLHINASE